MSSARVVLPPGASSLLRLLPTLFTLLVLAIAGAYVRPRVTEDRPANHRPAVRRVLATFAQAETPAVSDPPVFAVYLVDTEQDAYDIIRMFDDAYAPDVLLRRQGPWSQDASVFTLPSLHLSVLVIAGPEQELPARQLLADSAREIAAAGASLDVIDRRATK